MDSTALRQGLDLSTLTQFGPRVVNSCEGKEDKPRVSITYSAPTSPDKPQFMSDRIYFPVEDVKFQDLHDWSIPSQQCQSHRRTLRHPQRQNSETGAMAELNETEIALFRHGNEVFAINEKCPHAGGPLHVGDIEVLPDRSLCIRCPWHSWRFDLRTGKVRKPAGRNLTATVYPVKVEVDGTIKVGFKEFSPNVFSSEDF